MNVDDITIGELREIQKFIGSSEEKSSDSHWKIGKPYLIRTVTMIDTGILVSVNDKELVISDAAWIADTGRFSDALKSASFNEVEPFPSGEIIIGRGSIIDAVQIKSCPRKQN